VWCTSNKELNRRGVGGLRVGCVASRIGGILREEEEKEEGNGRLRPRLAHVHLVT
jgi:hypothetical protein